MCLFFFSLSRFHCQTRFVIRHLTLHVAEHKIYKTFRNKTLEHFKLCRSACYPYRKQKPQMVVNVHCVCCLQCRKEKKKLILRTTGDKVESRDLNFSFTSSTFGSGSGNFASLCTIYLHFRQFYI